MLFFTPMCVVMWGLYVHYTSSAVGHICSMWQAHLFRGHYANNVKSVYTSVPGHLLLALSYMEHIY